MSTLSITRPLTAANQEIAMPTASVTRKLFKLHWLELTRNRAQFIFAMVFPLFMDRMFFLISTVMPSSTAAGLWMMVKDVFSFDYTEAVGDSLKNLCIQSCRFQMV